MINREFFLGHKSAIIFVCHIENGKDMLTIDEKGHIFVWTYSKKFVDTRGVFKPSHKYRVTMEYLKMERLQQKANKSKSQSTSRQFNETYLDCMDYR